MKHNITYLITLFFSGIIHLLILLFSWNLRSGTTSSMSGIIFTLCLSYLLNIFLYLHYLGVIRTWSKKTPQKGEKQAPQEGKDDTVHIRREYVDPKTTADKLFKNVMLKRKIQDFGEKLLSNLGKEFEIMQGVFYIFNRGENNFEPAASYAIVDNTGIRPFRPGEAITGEAALKEEITILKNLPDNFRRIESGLGNHQPRFIIFIPLVHEKQHIGLIEISSFKEITDNKLNSLNYLTSLGGKKLKQFQEKING